MKIIKYLFELIFVFLLPILFIFISFQYKTISSYDSFGNLISSEKILDYSDNSILRDYNDNLHYKNILYLNQNLNGSFDSDSWTYYNANGTYSDDYIVLSFNSTFDIQFYTYKNLDPSHKYLILMKVSSSNNSYVGCRFGSDYNNFNLVANEITFIYNIGYPLSSNSEINFYIYYSQNDSTTLFNFYWGELIDLTAMFGSGYEPSSINDLYFDYTIYYQNGFNGEVIVQSNDIISIDYLVNYTWYTKFFNNFFGELQFNNNSFTKLIIIYLVLTIVFFFFWNLIYWPLSLLFRLLLWKKSYY